MTIKGKEVAGKALAGKRKRGDDKAGGGRNRKNRAILQFFEEAADIEESDDSDDSDFGDDFLEEEVGTVPIMKNEPAKAHSFPFFPKEEEMDEEEFDRMMEERYGDGSRFITFTGDEFDDKTIEPNSLHTDKDLTPTIWKVKCTVGRERLSAVCLMQKFADLKSLGTKLQIISAFAVDHMKGFVYIEAEKQFDINEACKGISGIYVTRVQPVPKNEVYHLFSARSRCNEISEGMWVRIKSGKYKGDLAQVAAVNNTRKRVTVKLIPRIDLQAMAAKFGGGYSLQKAAAPAPRLISSSELEEFRPLMQFRRDRDTGKVFEVLDGLMLKDGYVYKKVSPDSLNLWGVVPTEEEHLKFGPSENNESNDLQWLSQLYGDPKKKRVIRADKGGGKGESSSGSGVANGFELYDLVCFSRKDFGVIVGMDKDDSYKILKDSPDGPVAVTVERRDIKSGLFDLKLSSQDQHNKTISVNDTVRVLEGPSKGRRGIVKHIYRGIVFLYDENEEEKGGYFTSKSHMCEKVKLTVGDCSGKGSESGPSVFEDPGPSVFEDVPSSPKSPLSPKRPWQARENNREFNRGDKDGLFAIGQTLRIRIGPLKGYLCRVIALRRSDVTVKLDSQQKVLTVKCEHLSEVQGKSISVSSSGGPDSSPLKSFDLLGTEGSSGGWMDGVGTSAGGSGWNTGGMSAERNAWSSAPSFLKPESTSNPISSNGVEDTAWETKNTSNQNSSWGAAVEKNGIASEPDQSGGWGKSGCSWGQWGQAEHKSLGEDNQNTKWKNKANDLDGNQPSGWDSKSNWNSTKAAERESSSWNRKCVEHNKEGEEKGQSSWNTVKMSNQSSTTAWDQNQDAGWKNKPNKDGNNSSGWERKNNWNTPISSSQENSGWNQKSTEDDKEEKGQDQGGWSGGKTSDGSATGLGQASGRKKGLSDGAKGSNWDTVTSGSSAVAENQDSDWGKSSNWNPVSGDAGGSQGNGWGMRSSWKSGANYTNQGDCKHLDDSNEKKSDRDSSVRWGQDSGKIGSADGPKQASNWGDWKSGSSSGNENQNSNWSSRGTDAGSHDSNWGKKTNWNSGHSGNRTSDLNNSNWNSGSGDSDQKSNWGRNSNWNSNSSLWSAENENKSSNWSSGHTDAGNQVSDWGKKTSWNSGSGDANQNTNWRSNGNGHSGNSSNSDKLSDVNDKSDDGVGGGNWRGGYRGRGGSNSGFRGRGFHGRGERGGFGGRGEHGGFGGRGERGRFGGRGRADRESFGGRGGSERGYGGRGRGRSDHPGGWNNRRDSGEDGSSDWKGADNNVEGWKNSKGSGAWNQGSGDQGGEGWSQGNADKEHPSWNQDCGSNKQWKSWSSASGGSSGNWNSKGSEQPAESKDGDGWTKGMDSAQENISVKGNNWTSHGVWNQEIGDKKDGQSWSKGNAEKESPSWNQGGGSNKKWQSWSSASRGATGNWNSKWSEQSSEAKAGAGWTKGADSAQENVSVKRNSWTSQGAWKQETGEKEDGQSWSQGNPDKEHSSWNQGGGSNSQWQSWVSSSGGSEPLAETKDGAAWTKGTDSLQEDVSAKRNKWTSHEDHGSRWKKSPAAEEIEETNIQEVGWNKVPSSNTTTRGWDNQEIGWKSSAGSGNGSGNGDRVLNWGQSSAAEKGQSSSWNESIDGAAGSWGKENVLSDKGGR